MNSKITAYLCLFVASIAWGLGAPIVKYTLQYSTPFNFLFWRFLLTAILALPIFIWYLQKHPLNTRYLPKMILAGILVTTINISLVISGFARTTALEGSLLISVSPLFVVIGGVIFLKEKLNKRAWIGISLALLGAVVSIAGPLANNHSSGSFLGNILILCGGLTWTVFVLLSKRWEAQGIKPFHIASISFFVGPVTFLPLAILEGGKLPSLQNISPNAIFGILYLAIFCSIIAYSAYEFGLQKVQASKADVFNYLQSVWAAPLALVWLGESLSSTYLLGVILIVTGLILAEYKPGFIKGFDLPVFLRPHARGYHLAHHK